jgi:leader peptidase (prepilin peptidase)/N-methyltransferase
MIESLLRITFAAVLGACFGSFANVLAIRLHEESSLVGRSTCPACEKPIRPRHLVPIFSWLALRGRCADCGAKIHVQYPLVELSAALLTVIAAMRFDPFTDPAFYGEMLLSVGLVVLVVMDLRWKELPLELMGLIGACGLMVRLGSSLARGDMKAEIVSMFFALALALCFFGAQWMVSKGKWLGSGDVWFGAMISFVLGWPGTPIAMYLAYLAGGVVVACLFVARIIKRGTRVPFAPALAVGMLLAMWFGQPIERWISYAFSA